jgi:hypothetical protein
MGESVGVDPIARAGWLGAGANEGKPSAVQESEEARNRDGCRKSSLDIPRGTLNAILKQAGLKKGGVDE